MPYTKDQIQEYARKLGSKGAPAEEIEAFVSAASKDMVADAQPAAKQEYRGLAERAADPAGERRDPRTGLPDRRDIKNIPGNFDATMQYVLPTAALVGGPALSALTASAGNSAVQIRKQLMGEQEGLKVGDAVTAPALSLASPLKSVGVLRNAGNTAINATGAYLAEKLRSRLDDGKNGPPDNATMQAGVVGGLTAIAPALGPLLAKMRGNPVAQNMDEVATAMSRKQLNEARQYSLKGPDGGVRRLKVDPSVPAVRNEDDLLLKMAGGKAAMSQVVAKENVPVFQGMGRRDMGLPETSAGITKGEIKDLRESLYEPYDKIRQISAQAKDQLAKLENEVLGPKDGLSSAGLARRAELEADPEFQRMAIPLRTQAAADVEGLKKARGQASLAMKRYTGSEGKDVAAFDEYTAQREIADSLEDKISDAAKLSDDPELLERLTNNRSKLAQSHSYEDSIDPDGLINPQSLRLMLAAGVPLKGNALKIAQFANVARGNAVPLSRIGDPNANAATGLVGAVGALAQPEKAAWYASIPYVRNEARKRLTSEAGQDALVNPPMANQTNPEDLARLVRAAAIQQAVRARQGRD